MKKFFGFTLPFVLGCLASVWTTAAEGGLVGYWKFDESAGSTTAADSSLNDADGNVTNATFVPGLYGNALSFDGNDDYVTITNVAAAFAAMKEQVTISFWAYGNAASLPKATTILSASGPGESRVLNAHLPYSDQVVYWDAGADGGSYDRINKTASAADYEGRWTHWVFTKDATLGETTGVTRDQRMKIYMDGQLWHYGTLLGRKMDGINSFRISSGGGGAYAGLIDDFAVWDTELAPAAIQNLAAMSLETVQTGQLTAGTITAETIHLSLENSGGTISPGGTGVIATTALASGNLAPSGLAKQSSTRSGGGSALRANDSNTSGNFNNNSVSHTDTLADQWWRVDLGSTANLDSITLYNRTDCCGDRLSNFRVSVLDADDSEVWGQDYYTGGGNAGSSMNITLPAGIQGEYVLVSLLGTSARVLSLAEVEVFGNYDYTQTAGGTLEIEVDGLAGTADKLATGGILALDGTLNVSLLSQPTHGLVLDILDWGTLTGEFSTINLPGLTMPSLDWDLSRLYTTGELLVVPEPSTLGMLLGLAGAGLLGCRRRRRS